jgi:hypothetical protein
VTVFDLVASPLIVSKSSEYESGFAHTAVVGAVDDLDLDFAITMNRRRASSAPMGRHQKNKKFGMNGWWLRV